MSLNRVSLEWAGVRSFFILSIVCIFSGCSESAVQGDASSPGDVIGTTVVDVAGEGSPDPGASDLVPPSEPEAQPCAEIVAEADNLRAPVDIIWVVDTSGSMDQEAEMVEERLNDFASYIEGTGLDYRVILIAGMQSNHSHAIDVCIGPPLSPTDECPEENGPRYRRVQHYVHSNAALSAIHATYEQYQDFLRPNSIVHFVAVSDDESDMSSERFRQRLGELTDPGFDDNWVFHSIVSDHYPDEEWVLIPGLIEFEAGCDGPYGSAEAYGEQYDKLTEESGGVFSEICTAEWDPIFSGIATSVLDSSQLPCVFSIPEPPPGMAFVPSEITIQLETELGLIDVDHVADESQCNDGVHWYFDSNDAPTQVLLCPDACGDLAGRLQITLGCIKG